LDALMPLGITDIADARNWALREYQAWKSQIMINDDINADKWSVLHDDATSEDSEPLVPNLYKQALEDKMNTAGSIAPQIQVHPKLGTRKDAGEKSAQIRRRVHLSYDDRSAFDINRYRYFRDFLHTGMSVCMPWVDFASPLTGEVLPPAQRFPYINRIDPRQYYPLTYDSRHQVTGAMFIRQRRAKALEREWGHDHPGLREILDRQAGKIEFSEDDLVEEIWYFDSMYWAVAFLDPLANQTQYAGSRLVPKELATAPVTGATVTWATEPELHRLPACPVVENPRITHDDQMPRGALEDIIPQLRIANNFMQRLLDDQALNISAPILLDGIENYEDYGPGAVLEGDGTGNARMQTLRTPVNFEATATVRQILEDVRGQAFQPQQRSGQIGASIASDRAVQSVQAQFNEELNHAQAIHEFGWSKVHQLTAALDELWCYGSKTIVGEDDGNSYEETYDPADIFGGDYRVKVAYGPQRGLDMQQNLTALAMMKNLGGTSRRSMMQKSGMVSNVLQEERDIALEQLTDLFFMGILPQQIEAGNLEALIGFVDLIDADEMTTREAVMETIRTQLQPVQQEMGAGGEGGGGPADILQMVKSLQAGGIPGQAEGQPAPPPIPGGALRQALPSGQRRQLQEI
jgi:hypothetical protein